MRDQQRREAIRDQKKGSTEGINKESAIRGQQRESKRDKQ